MRPCSRPSRLCRFITSNSSAGNDGSRKISVSRLSTAGTDSRLHSTENVTSPAPLPAFSRALSLSSMSSISCRLCFFVPRVMSRPSIWAAVVWPLSESASPKRSVSSKVASSPRVFFGSRAVLTPLLSSP